MTFRDEREALRARNEALADENRALREEIEEMRRKAEPPPEEPAPPEPPENDPARAHSPSLLKKDAPSGSWTSWLWVLAVVAGFGGCGFTLCTRSDRTRQPNIEAPLALEARFDVTVRDAQGVALPAGTACNAKMTMMTNGDYADHGNLVVTCGELKWDSSWSSATWIRKRSDGLAITSFATPATGGKSSAIYPGYDLDTAAGELIVYNGYGQPFWMDFAVTPGSIKQTAGPPASITETEPHRAATHEVKWTVTTRAQGCYFLSGPDGLEKRFGRRVAIDGDVMEFWGKNELRKVGNAFERDFISAEPTHYLVKDRIRLTPTGIGVYAGSYHYEECDGAKCGQCALDATMMLTALSK